MGSQLSALRVLLMVPMLVPVVTLAIALLMVFVPRTCVCVKTGRLLRALHVALMGLKFVRLVMLDTTLKKTTQIQGLVRAVVVTLLARRVIQKDPAQE
tara:strand:+ start:83 stop:376 length:294 start_codon:yes stop_codon:yes gene_type:complete